MKDLVQLAQKVTEATREYEKARQQFVVEFCRTPHSASEIAAASDGAISKWAVPCLAEKYNLARRAVTREQHYVLLDEDGNPTNAVKTIPQHVTLYCSTRGY